MSSDAMVEAAKAHWQRELAGMTGEQIRQAIATCMSRIDDKGESWPPNPTEFRHAGKPQQGGMYRPAPKRLPRPKRTDDEIEAGRQALRDALRVGVTHG